MFRRVATWQVSRAYSRHGLAWMLLFASSLQFYGFTSTTASQPFTVKSRFLSAATIRHQAFAVPPDNDEDDEDDVDDGVSRQMVRDRPFQTITVTRQSSSLGSLLARHMVYRYANKWHRADACKKHTIRFAIRGKRRRVLRAIVSGV